MKEILLTLLRDKKTDVVKFREVAYKLALILANDSSRYLEKREINITTPITNALGLELKNDIVLIPILRAALSMLPAFLEYYPKAKVGFIGLKRDEKTAIAQMYYKNLPKIKDSDDVMILDPMIATGGTGLDAIKLLIASGVREEKIIFMSVISSKTGVNRIKKKFSKVTIVFVSQDEKLNKDSYIVPGLGDFGDRFFGTL